MKPLDDTAAELKKEFCRGQEPVEVPAEIFDKLDAWSQSYVRKNVNQFLDAGCKV